MDDPPSESESVFSFQEDVHFDVEVPLDEESCSHDSGSVSLDSGSRSGASSGSGTTTDVSSSPSRASGNTSSRSEAEHITTLESKHLVKLRGLLFGVLFWSTVGVALAVWSFFSEAEESAFEDRYNEDSLKVLESVNRTFELSLGTIDAFVVSMVSLARFTDQEWPFVSLPDYSVRVAKMRQLSRAVHVTQYHYVAEDQKLEWQKYTTENDEWIEQAIEQQRNDGTFNGTMVIDPNEDFLDSPVASLVRPLPYGLAVGPGRDHFLKIRPFLSLEAEMAAISHLVSILQLRWPQRRHGEKCLGRP